MLSDHLVRKLFELCRELAEISLCREDDLLYGLVNLCLQGKCLCCLVHLHKRDLLALHREHCVYTVAQSEAYWHPTFNLVDQVDLYWDHFFPR